MRQETNFDIAVRSLAERRRFNYDSHRKDRGYSTDGDKLWLNGHLIVQWYDSAVRMYLNAPEWHSFLVAQAIPRVRDYFAGVGLLAERDEVTCKLHEDCRSHAELGAACGASRAGKPMPLPYFEAQEERRRSSQHKSVANPRNDSERNEG